jgi:hypothetical protein
VSLRGTPKLASTDCLDVRKTEVLVVVQVVEDLVVHCVKGAVVGGFEGSQNDRPKNIVNGDRVHVLESTADINHFAEVGVNSVLGVTICDKTEPEHTLRAAGLCVEHSTTWNLAQNCSLFGRKTLCTGSLSILTSVL